MNKFYGTFVKNNKQVIDIMNLKKLYKFSSKGNLWRLLPTESDKLVIETRNMDKQEAELHCLDTY